MDVCVPLYLPPPPPPPLSSCVNDEAINSNWFIHTATDFYAHVRYYYKCTTPVTDDASQYACEINCGFVVR